MKSALNLISAELDAIREAGTWRGDVPMPAPARRKRQIACDEPFYFINGTSRAPLGASR